MVDAFAEQTPFSSGCDSTHSESDRETPGREFCQGRSSGAFLHATALEEAARPSHRSASPSRLKGGDSWHGTSVWETVNWEDRYVRLVRAARDAIVLTSPEGMILSLNPAFEAITGWLRGRCLGEFQWDLLHPDDVEKAKDAWQRCLNNESVPLFETRVRCRTGGHALLEWLITPQIANGETLAVLGIARDVTALRQTEQELKRAEEHLRHAQKMDALGRMASGVAHDFNNLLTIILGFGEMLLSGIPEEDPRWEAAIQVIKAGERGTWLTRQLLAFSRKQSIDPRVLDLNAVVIETEGMLQRLLGEQFIVNLILDPDVGRVKAEARQIEHIVFNLANNARDAMPNGGTIVVRTANAEIMEGASGSLNGLLPGSYVALSFTDTGCGMDKATRARLFEPFFSTKGPGKGTGLGLATAYGIVKQCGGTIEVESETGQGTTVTIYLPVTGEPLAVEDQLFETPSRMSAAETVMVAEDNEAVRTLATRVLRAAGYRVLEAADGDEAVEVCAGYTGPIHLLVTDVIMPRVSGQELADRLAVLRPEMRVLFMSGRRDDGVFAGEGEEPEGAFLAKPFTPGVLVRKVRALLATRAEVVTA